MAKLEFSLALTACDLRTIFFVSSQFVHDFPVMIHCISYEVFMWDKLILCFYGSDLDLSIDEMVGA